MKRPRRQRPLVIALYLNAGLLACILVAMLSRSSSISVLPQALAEAPPIAGGGGMYLMPGQVAQNVYGVYMMDIDAQTLMVYQYTPGDNLLKLKASRSFKYDRRLQNFNSGAPSPEEVKDLIERQQQPARGLGSTNSLPGTDK
jgi:hypothetical protein